MAGLLNMPQQPGFEPLVPAELSTDARGLPYSVRYADVYHPHGGALNQARHVFLGGNGLPRRWQGREGFTVCETGFGMGINFLALWRAWRDDPARCARLHVVSFEAHPVTREELQRVHGAVLDDTAMQQLAASLRQAWPPHLPGVHRLDFDDLRVTLTLVFGDAATCVSRLDFAADAFFLDGFDPRRNPVMWSPDLMRDLASRAAPDATLATWCSAGTVRRGLRDAGFEVRKAPGFAGKTHMTLARRAAGAGCAAPAATPMPAGAGVVVVGAGLAAAGIAHGLALRGLAVTVLDPAPAHPAHAGHLAAALSPVVTRDDNARTRLVRAGVLRALARWQTLGEDARPWRCGTLQIHRDPGRAVSAAAALDTLCFPPEWVRNVDSAEASARAGLPLARGGLFFSEGQLVRPQVLIDALLATPGITRMTGHAARLTPEGGDWRVDIVPAPVPETVTPKPAPASITATVVVLASAFDTPALLARSGLLDACPGMQQMHRLAGQVTFLPAAEVLGGPRCIVGGEGYLLPAVEGYCVAGSTYEHGAAATAVSPEGYATNVAKAARLLGLQRIDGVLPPAWAAAAGSAQVSAATRSGLAEGSITLPATWAAGAPSDAAMPPGWAGWRAVLPGRLPAIGPLEDAPGLFVATGYASRGLTWSALAGDIIAARLCGEPAPLERDLTAVIAPR